MSNVISPQTGAKTTGPRSAVIFALTVFLSGFLLFQVQPLIGRFILPVFGGSPEVWTTCMLAFQMLLLAGYAYAHLTVTTLRPPIQAGLHIVLLAVAIAALPMIPPAGYRPDPLAWPTIQVLLLLGATIALPFFVLSATGPLLQRWLAGFRPGRSPYRLYALSNAGSLLALVSYPFLIEPLLSRRSQAQVWSAGLMAFAVMCGVCAVVFWRRNPLPGRESGQAEASEPEDTTVTAGARALWVALPAVASVELLAVTNKICQDVASVPFLWVLPLCIYLLSFVVCFHHQKWYSRPIFLPAFAAAIVAVMLAKVYAGSLSAPAQISIYSAALLTCCMVCHGELFRIRPHPRHLTAYYLMIAAGGALGGFLVAVVAPLAFDSYRELHLGLLACCMCLVLGDDSPALRRGGRRWIYASLILLVGLIAVFSQDRRGEPTDEAVLSTRNFFGVLTIWEKDAHDRNMHRHVLQHGTTFHGLQFTRSGKRLLPTAYYGPKSGIGLTLRHLLPDPPRRIGAVGLGIGTVATYCQDADSIRFYEIDPEVVRLAEEHFEYLSRCQAEVETILGDARISMEAEPPQSYDVIVLDAFAGGTVPAHLLTTEAFEVYLGHLTEDGIIAAHVSSVHLNLAGLVEQVGRHLGLQVAHVQNAEDPALGIFESDWVLLARRPEVLNHPSVAAGAPLSEGKGHKLDVWTDDHINLFQALR